jgi:hypothetical protein
MLDKPTDTRRETLERYHRALSGENWLPDINLVTKRFVANHRIGADHALGPELRAILDAHKSRVAGLSSPSETDRIVKGLIG